MTAWMLAGGLVMLVVGGDLLVRGAVRGATALGVSPLMIGLTLVGFGTSTPELMTSVQAALVGSPGVAVGNVVGSNICNILLILGIAALINPVTASPAAFRRDGPALGAATLLCLAALLMGELGRLAGLGFLALLVLYVVATYRLERAAGADAAADLHRHGIEATSRDPLALVIGIPMAMGGLGMVMVGAGWLVDAAIAIARGLGVTETLIGLTIVAVGTSLPELTASAIAAWRGQSDLAFGNVVGSNIYNILGILGVTALIRPVPVPPEIIAFDGWVMVAATAALIVFTLSGWVVTRREGGALLAAYGAYLGWLGLTAA